MVIRGFLESAIYAHYISLNSALDDVWLDRGTSEQAREAARKAFTASRAMAGLKRQHPDLHSDFFKLYNRAIELGAHPNVGSVLTFLDVDVAKNRVSLQALADDSLARRLCLTTLLHGSLVALAVLAHAFPERAEKAAFSRAFKSAHRSFALHGA